ncbi:putative polypeptide N-acetylgalactosaminyltransferase 9 [Drosophila miranda]|uniref:putative polypeptide N-acetylgalactosaminyltransferase 9 n=1 Tax=Drosophila miranda TaxID=7229 RepID=UPI00143F653B|nr:putative polypeptide N-acetylgalactosaminyltransferase 9 [Drosophila miranda]
MEAMEQSTHHFLFSLQLQWRSGVNGLRKNSVRLAEVWMDEYSQYYYHPIGNDKGDWGDVSDRKKLREDLQSKSFKWYLDNIYPELFIPGDAVAHGEIRNLGYGGRTCLDSPTGKKHQKKAAGLYPCHRQGGNQVCFATISAALRPPQTPFKKHKKTVNRKPKDRTSLIRTPTSFPLYIHLAMWWHSLQL